MNLVIVESPTKARTLSKFLGKDYQIEATMGHIRDLPKDDLGVDINQDFKPSYVIPREKKKVVARLKAQGLRLRGSDSRSSRLKAQIILATDLDREGEAIAYHVAVICSNSKFSRIVFHEITKSAIEEALKNPRGIDMNLVNAQQGRRILDRLVGYKLSPLLWYKTGKNWLSAGRVQSVAVRLICEREREIAAFVPQEYWKINVKLKTKKEKREFFAELIRIENQKAEIKNKEQAERVVAFLKKADYKVENIKKEQRKNPPPPPFITSTLQRAGVNVFGWPARKTMMIAQNLYEQGLITYHRTDSVKLSQEALAMVREYIAKVYGEDYLPPQPRVFKTKSKLAQEAHEAIRPTRLNLSEVEPLRGSTSSLGKDHQKLLDLISKRFLACQMREEEKEVTVVTLKAQGSRSSTPRLRLEELKAQDFEEMMLEARGERQVFEGWRRVYVKNSKSQIPNSKQPRNSKSEIQNILLPPLSEGEKLNLIRVLPEQKFTQPPARYNEASLIKVLEEKGIGRPSTYAPIISTIQARHYVEKEERRFKPTELGVAVNDFLVKNFGETINVEFTAKMEDELDEIAKGKLKWVEVVRDFWEPFQEQISKSKEQKEKIKVKLEEVAEKCPRDGGQLVVRIGKFGKFLACGNFPKCKFTKPLVEKTGLKCPKCRAEVVLKKTKKGRRFYGCSNYPECNFASWTKPKTGNM